MTLSKSQHDKITRALAHHEKWSNSYFWTPKNNASGRRHEENKNTWTVKFKYRGDIYEYSSVLSVSCKHYYYDGTFCKNGKNGDVRTFKKLLEGQK